jgi:hypothetical protein
MQPTVGCTMLDVLQTVKTLTADDHEATAVVAPRVNGGHVRLASTLAGAKIRLSSPLPSFPKELWPALLGLPVSSLQRGSL